MNYKELRCIKTEDRMNLKNIDSLDCFGLTRFDFLFDNFKSLENINDILQTNNYIYNSECMFKDCNNLRQIPNIPTENVENMEMMFYNCYLLKTVPIPFTTNKCVNFDYTFYNCKDINHICINIENVNSMKNTFKGCNNLRSLLIIGEETNFNDIIDLRDTKMNHSTIVQLIELLPEANYLPAIDFRGIDTKLSDRELQRLRDKDWFVILNEEDYYEYTKEKS